MKNSGNQKTGQSGFPGRKRAAAGLFVNVIFPGLGTLAAGRVREGFAQAFLFAAGLLLGVFGTSVSFGLQWSGVAAAMFGTAMMITAWVWSIAVAAVLVRRAAVGAIS